MNSFFKIIKNSFSDFRRSFYINLKFEGMFKLITSFFVLPLMSILINYFLSLSGRSFITNGDLLNFSKSIPGFLCILVLIIIASASIILELGTLIIISRDIYFGIKPNLKRAFIGSIQNLPKIFSIGSLKILLYILVLVPLLNLGLNSSFISSLTIPNYILNALEESTLGNILLIILFVASYFFLIRWLFALHISIIEGKSFTKSIKTSKKISKGKYIYISSIIIFIHIIVFIISMLLMVIFSISIPILIFKIGPSSLASINILSLYSTLQSSFLIIFSLFTTPLTVIVITRLYFHISKHHSNYYNLHPSFLIEKDLTLQKIKKNKPLFRILILFLACFLFLIVSILFYSQDLKNNTQITAHRGNSSVAPENTLSAIKSAIDVNADFAEIDVQETKDGNLVLTHDSNFKRISNIDKNVYDVTLKEIKTYDVGSNFSPVFKGEKIPTLEEAIKLSKNKIKLNIEIKLNGHEKNLVTSVVNLIEKENFIDQCVVTSLDYDVLKEVRKLNPNIKIGYIMFVALGNLSSMDVDFYSIERTNVTKAFVKRAHNLGRQVHVWTVDDETDANSLIDMKVDNIITNYPKLMRNLLNDRKKEERLDDVLK
ncbi:hypothetical protein C3495_03920 [Clostridiaceae bacterium 14S0207]|nr:hypothetical protein C3495_03920 [Clostridiaceae bacterium 14S0207]